MLQICPFAFSLELDTLFFDLLPLVLSILFDVAVTRVVLDFGFACFCKPTEDDAGRDGDDTLASFKGSFCSTLGIRGLNSVLSVDPGICLSKEQLLSLFLSSSSLSDEEAAELFNSADCSEPFLIPRSKSYAW